MAKQTLHIVRTYTVEKKRGLMLAETLRVRNTKLSGCLFSAIAIFVALRPD